MRFVLKVVAVLLVAAALALIGYALLFDLPAPVRDITVPVEAR